MDKVKMSKEKNNAGSGKIEQFSRLKHLFSSSGGSNPETHVDSTAALSNNSTVNTGVITGGVSNANGSRTASTESDSVRSMSHSAYVAGSGIGNITGGGFASRPVGLSPRPTMLHLSLFMNGQIPSGVTVNEVAEAISVEQPIAVRIRIIKELCQAVKTNEFSRPEIELLWFNVCDLLQKYQPSEARQLVLLFMSCVAKGQYIRLGPLRRTFFATLFCHKIAEDSVYRLDALRKLSNNGRDVSYFENDIGKFIYTWLQEMRGQTYASEEGKCRQQELLSYLFNVIKFNSTVIDETVMNKLIRQTCAICNSAKVVTDVDICLDVLDVYVRYSFFSVDSLPPVVETLSRAVNIEKFCHRSWQIIKCVLKSDIGHVTLGTLCSILEAEANHSHWALVRGAVFFLGMACWGSQRIDTLKPSFSAILPSLYRCLSFDQPIVAYEVVLSLSRLIKMYSEDLTPVEWDQMLDILSELQRYYYLLEESGLRMRDSSFRHHLDGVLQKIEALYENPNFKGASQHLIEMFDHYRNDRPEESVLLWLGHHKKLLEPSRNGCIERTCLMMDNYFVNETRPAIRMKALSILQDLVNDFRLMSEDLFIKNIILVYLKDIHINDADPYVRRLGIQLIGDIAKDTVHPLYFNELMALLQKAAATCPPGTTSVSLNSEGSSPRSKRSKSTRLSVIEDTITKLANPLASVTMATGTSDGTTTPSTEHVGGDVGEDGDEGVSHEEVQLHVAFVAIKAIIDIFKHKINLLPSSQALQAFELILWNAQTYYRNISKSAVANQCRLEIIKLITSVRADSTYNIYLCTEANTNGDSSIPFYTAESASPYIRCAKAVAKATLDLEAGENHNSAVGGERELYSEPVSPVGVRKHSIQPIVANAATGAYNAQSAYGVFGTITSYPIGHQKMMPVISSLNLKLAMDVMYTCLIHETQYECYDVALQGLLAMFRKKNLIMGSGIDPSYLCQSLCGLIMKDKLAFHVVNIPSPGGSRWQLYVFAYHILVLMVSYQQAFSRSLKDDLLACFRKGLVSKWRNLTKPCIYALRLCCLELQQPITRMLPHILNDLNKVSSKASLAIPILEFLSGIIRIHKLYANFTEDHYKIIFGLVLNFADHARYPLYTVALAYHVITVWFIRCRMSNRLKFAKYIVDRLSVYNTASSTANRNQEGQPLGMELLEACMDMLARYTFSSCKSDVARSLSADRLFASSTSKAWVYGNSIIVANTSSEPGWAELVICRPYGSTSWLMRCQNRQYNQIGDLLESPMAMMAFFRLGETVPSEPPQFQPQSTQLRNDINEERARIAYTQQQQKQQQSQQAHQQVSGSAIVSSTLYGGSAVKSNNRRLGGDVSSNMSGNGTKSLHDNLKLYERSHTQYYYDSSEEQSQMDSQPSRIDRMEIYSGDHMYTDPNSNVIYSKRQRRQHSLTLKTERSNMNANGVAGIDVGRRVSHSAAGNRGALMQNEFHIGMGVGNEDRYPETSQNGNPPGHNPTSHLSTLTYADVTQGNTSTTDDSNNVNMRSYLVSHQAHPATSCLDSNPTFTHHVPTHTSSTDMGLDLCTGEVQRHNSAFPGFAVPTVPITPPIPQSPATLPMQTTSDSIQSSPHLNIDVSLLSLADTTSTQETNVPPRDTGPQNIECTSTPTTPVTPTGTSLESQESTNVAHINNNTHNIKTTNTSMPTSIVASTSLFYPPLLSYEANSTHTMSPGFWDSRTGSQSDQINAQRKHIDTNSDVGENNGAKHVANSVGTVVSEHGDGGTDTSKVNSHTTAHPTSLESHCGRDADNGTPMAPPVIDARVLRVKLSEEECEIYGNDNVSDSERDMEPLCTRKTGREATDENEYVGVECDNAQHSFNASVSIDRAQSEVIRPTRSTPVPMPQNYKSRSTHREVDQAPYVTPDYRRSPTINSLTLSVRDQMRLHARTGTHNDVVVVSPSKTTSPSTNKIDDEVLILHLSNQSGTTSESTIMPVSTTTSTAPCANSHASIHTSTEQDSCGSSEAEGDSKTESNHTLMTKHVKDGDMSTSEWKTDSRESALQGQQMTHNSTEPLYADTIDAGTQNEGTATIVHTIATTQESARGVTRSSRRSPSVSTISIPSTELHVDHTHTHAVNHEKFQMQTNSSIQHQTYVQPLHKQQQFHQQSQMTANDSHKAYKSPEPITENHNKVHNSVNNTIARANTNQPQQQAQQLQTNHYMTFSHMNSGDSGAGGLRSERSEGMLSSIHAHAHTRTPQFLPTTPAPGMSVASSTNAVVGGTGQTGAGGGTGVRVGSVGNIHRNGRMNATASPVYDRQRYGRGQSHASNTMLPKSVSSAVTTDQSSRTPMTSPDSGSYAPRLDEKEEQEKKTANEIMPSYLLAQLFQYDGKPGALAPVPILPEHEQDGTFERALRLLHKMPCRDTHKIGVVYVAEGNTSGDDILRNDHGSVRYMKFLQKLGTLIRLEKSELYTGGLDREENADGEYTYHWQDDITEVVFHVATLMPCSQAMCVDKKRHIGNDFVTIVYNDTSRNYNLQAIRGQFNFIDVIIQPLEDNTNEVLIRTKEVMQTYVPEKFDEIISDASLATFVRHIAIHANLASCIQQQSEDYVSNAVGRLRHIKRIGERMTSSANSPGGFIDLT
eukprot:CFRG0767T1